MNCDAPVDSAGKAEKRTFKDLVVVAIVVPG